MKFTNLNLPIQFLGPALNGMLEKPEIFELVLNLSGSNLSGLINTSGFLFIPCKKMITSVPAGIIFPSKNYKFEIDFMKKS